MTVLQGFHYVFHEKNNGARLYHFHIGFSDHIYEMIKAHPSVGIVITKYCTVWLIMVPVRLNLAKSFSRKFHLVNNNFN